MLLPAQAFIFYSRGVSAAADRLEALEQGQVDPSRPMLVKMVKQYRRPLVTFYLPEPPRTGDRGQDFRTLPPDYSEGDEAVGRASAVHRVGRGFALADEVAPFVVINHQDHRGAWSFTLLHELTHLWLGETGVSGELHSPSSSVTLRRSGTSVTRWSPTSSSGST